MLIPLVHVLSLEQNLGNEGEFEIVYVKDFEDVEEACLTCEIYFGPSSGDAQTRPVSEDTHRCERR